MFYNLHAGGYASGSLAIMGDAVHMISDLASLLVSLIAIWVGSRQPKKSYNFGFARAEVLGALVTVMIIWYVSGVLVYLALHRIQTKEFEVQSDLMILGKSYVKYLDLSIHYYIGYFKNVNLSKFLIFLFGY